MHQDVTDVHAPGLFLLDILGGLGKAVLHSPTPITAIVLWLMRGWPLKACTADGEILAAAAYEERL